jgi:hypothetical protein
MNPDKELLWKQYALYVDLYKFYLDITVKINLLYYGITGAILSFYFTHSSAPLVQWSLGLPIAMSVVLSGIFFYGANLMTILRADMFNIRDQISLSTAPDLGILTIALRAFGGLMVVVAVFLAVFIITENRPSQLPKPTITSVTSTEVPLTHQ